MRRTSPSLEEAANVDVKAQRGAGRCASFLQSTQATEVEVLRVPPGNRLHPLEGDRAGQRSVSVSDQWGICFRFEDGDAYDVEICDYY